MHRIALLAGAICAAFVTSLAGCASGGAEQSVSCGSHRLAEHQVAKLSRTVSVRYDRFEDSRCPKDSACIWAGKLSYHFTLLSQSGSERFALGGEGEQHVSTVLPGIRFGMSLAGMRERPFTEHAVVLDVDVLQLDAPSAKFPTINASTLCSACQRRRALWFSAMAYRARSWYK